MKIHIGEFLNLIDNGLVPDGEELSFSAMVDLRVDGLSGVDSEDNNIPTDKGRAVYEKLIKSTIEVKETYEFKF